MTEQSFVCWSQGNALGLRVYARIAALEYGVESHRISPEHMPRTVVVLALAGLIVTVLAMAGILKFLFPVPERGRAQKRPLADAGRIAGVSRRALDIAVPARPGCTRLIDDVARTVLLLALGGAAPLTSPIRFQTAF